MTSANNGMQPGGAFGGIHGTDYMNRTVRNEFGVGTPIVPAPTKKSWKETKLYKGTTLSHFKESRGDAYKKSEIQKILDDKDEVIKRQKLEIMMLVNKIEEKKREMINKQNN